MIDRKAEWEKRQEVAEQYGVTRSRFYQRVKAGWELDEAATTPPVKPGQKTARREQGRKWNNVVLFVANRRGRSND